MLVQGPKKPHKNHLHLNKLATLGANNFLSKRDASGSEHLAKSKLEYTILFCVFIVATIDYSDEVSSKLEGVTWELFLKLVDLTWNE